MQAVILVAGMGNRLGKYTKNNTKCMLEINGRTLAARALDALVDNGIPRCIIVAGYQKDNLVQHIGHRWKGMEIVWIFNDIYDKTNNIYSLWLARDWLLKDDTLLLESDLIFEDKIIKQLLDKPDANLAVVDRYESWMDGTVVKIADDQTILRFVPKKDFNYCEAESYYKTVNIYKFSRSFLENTYVPFLEAYAKAMGQNEYYEQVLKVIASLETNELKALCLDGQRWYEIDDIQDKDIAEALFCNSAADELAALQKRYGGYWRFPKLLDFCYLVNPWFPVPLLKEELKASFDVLLADYPSGQSIQNLLAAKLFSVDEEHILVGNGAAELIRALDKSLEGSVGCIYPTFNEYPESLSSHEIVPLVPQDFHYGAKELILWMERCDNLVLINPDNPSGNCVSKDDILALLEKIKGSGKRLVLDESFMDFTEDAEQQSIFSRELLDRYPELLIIKSISKSYGVPGIRLGVAASSDSALILRMKKELTIWNINSFGEFFLQIIGKYRKEYAKACQSIIAERTRFVKELSSIPWLDILPSQANYLMCHITASMDAATLAQELLSKHRILIKDLSGKKGIPDSKWIRIAVRNRQDNDRLLQALRGMGE